MRTEELDRYGLHGLQPVLQVADMDEAVAFYRDVLGFEIDFVFGDPPVHARVSSGDRESGSAVRIRFVPTPGGGPTSQHGYIWVHVDNRLDELFEEYRQAGVEVVSPPKDQHWGLRDFRIQDPNGHVYCFAAEIGPTSKG